MPRRNRRPRPPDRSSVVDQPAETGSTTRFGLALPQRRDPQALERLQGLRDRLAELYPRLEAQVQPGGNRPPLMMLAPARDSGSDQREPCPDRVGAPAESAPEPHPSEADTHEPVTVPKESIHHRAGAALCDPGHFVWSWGQVIGRSDDYDHAAHALARGLARRGWAL